MTDQTPTLGDAIREQAARATSAERRRALYAIADRADALERDRDDAQENTRLAVEQCRYLHQDGLTREEWHTKHCGAMQGLRQSRAQVERARVLADGWDRVHASGEDYHASDLRAALDGDS